MGLHNKSLASVIEEKDEEISVLETRLRAYIAKTSLLQNRLLSTLDTLDVIQNAHNEELDAVSRTKNRLKDKLDRYIDVVKVAELERDDLRDAVLKLVEKVELSNDYSKWPHSRIHLSSLAADSTPLFQGSRVQIQEEDLHSYASTMIEALRKERDSERIAHAQTHEWAEAKIVALEAQLSRREAELESCIARADHAVLTPQTKRSAQARVLIEPITSEQVISMLDVTAARNRMLEVEIKTLFKRLEKARFRVSSPSPSGEPPPFTLTAPQQRRDVHHTSTSRPSTPKDPASNKHPETRLALAHEASEIYAPSPLPPLGASELFDPFPASANRLDGHIMESLDHHIRQLGEKIDDFATERKHLLQSLSAPSQDSRPSNVTEERLTILENECERLRRSDSFLRDEIESIKMQARFRENELLTEMQSLKRMHQRHISEERDNYHGDVHNLLEPDDGEISMELATPLLPTSMILNRSSSHSRSHSPAPYVDPPTIPLPPSPENEFGSNSPTLSQILLDNGLIYGRQESSLNAEIDRVGMELMEAERQLEAGGLALDEVEILVHELHPS
ncbi:hypothetical protein B0H34DRAFT_705875 [Crassisporium funariophilum]|nr:hypothetical protein B0H34DRAFT_705875 [Crassisporium funariophilum]